MTKPLASSTDNIAATNGHVKIPVSPLSSQTIDPASPDHLPPLARDPSFWGMTVTQFLGAFNDSLFKQLILLLSIVPLADGGVEDRQWLAMTIFTIPFLALTGLAGFVSDRVSKRRVVITCKIAEIIIMALGAFAFIAYDANKSLLLPYTVLFLLATHSAFFGPAKLGILPEMLRAKDLPRANGIMLMTLFLALIFGTALAGVLSVYFGTRLWIASVVCMSISTIGIVASLFVRRVPPANPELAFEPAALTVPHDIRALLRRDRPLLAALAVSSTFWLLAGMVPQAVNVLGTAALKIGDGWTSVMSGSIGLGIALGCVIGGFISRGQVDFRLLRAGSVGMLVCLALMAIPARGDASLLINAAGEMTHLPGIGETAQWLGFWGSLPVLIALGGFTGLFAVPLQVFMQSRPPADSKGRMIAVMNQANWVGILVAAGLYGTLAWLIKFCQWPQSVMFLFIAAMMLPIAIFYHPKNEVLKEST
jgi:MFS family permease